MRATCGVVSARSPIMRWLIGSISRKVWSATAAPEPASRLSSNSSSGGFHPLIAVAGEGLGQHLDQHRLPLRLGRQQVGEAGGQQGGAGRVVGHVVPGVDASGDQGPQPPWTAEGTRGAPACFIPVMRRFLAPLLALLGGCADPAAEHLFGIGDPVRGAALNAPALLGDTSRHAGRPGRAALAAVQMEVLAEAFRNDPRYAPEASGAAQHATRLGRAEMRRAIGIADDAPPEAVIAQLREASAALDAGSPARAEAALGGPMFPAGAAATLRRLAALPYLPRASEAAAMANAEIGRINRGARSG
jgi:hypothetical protein